ncbi:MAG: tyrosine-type recombinase/integrase [Pyrinomonadaceae bacterium]
MGRIRRQGKSVKDLTKQDFLLWAQSEIARGLRASSVQRRLNNIRASLNYAREIYPVLQDFKIPRYALGKEALRERMRILDETEIRALSRALQSKKAWRDAFDFFRVALGCGGRFDEIVPVVIRRDMTTAGIKWSDINKTRGTVRLFSGKTGKERVIYAPQVVEILLDRKKAKLGNETHAFCCRDHHIRKVFAKVSKQCKIPYGQQTPGGWTVHDMRHTCLTNLLQSGVDLATVRGCLNFEWSKFSDH